MQHNERRKKPKKNIKKDLYYRRVQGEQSEIEILQ